MDRSRLQQCRVRLLVCLPYPDRQPGTDAPPPVTGQANSALTAARPSPDCPEQGHARTGHQSGRHRVVAHRLAKTAEEEQTHGAGHSAQRVHHTEIVQGSVDIHGRQTEQRHGHSGGHADPGQRVLGAKSRVDALSCGFTRLG
jgi:hypothetical protein